MPSWNEAERFITTTGLAVFLVVVFVIGIGLCLRAVWNFCKPHITRWFDEQVKWFQSQTSLMTELIAFMQLTTKHHRQDRKAFISLGKAIHELAPDERREKVREHVQDIEQHFENDE